MPSPRITVQLAPDGLTARVSVGPGDAVSAEQLTQLLTEAGVVFGVSGAVREQLVEALNDPTYQVSDCVVAHALQPTLGSSGRFVAAFEPGIQPGHLRDDGSMDFFDRELLKPFARGDALGVLLPAQPGTAGCKVDGTAIAPPRVHELALQLGPGVLRHADGRLTAARSGVLSYVPGKSLDVVDHHTHAGDVDLRSGHLEMTGSLLVQKSVHRHFQVHASGDVEVLGGVDGGSVEAGGSIRVKGVVQGAESQLTSVGNISLRHAERATVRCGGLLQVHNAVHCQLSAERIEVSGRLRGGSARAELSVVASEIGTAGPGDMLVAAGMVLSQPVDDVLQAVNLAKAQRALAHRGGPGRDKGAKLGRAQAVLAADSLEHKLAQLATRERLLGQAFVEVRGTIHPGVTIQLGALRLLLEQPASSTRFSVDLVTRTIRAERIQR